jgi:hypothetical protein
MEMQKACPAILHHPHCDERHQQRTLKGQHCIALMLSIALKNVMQINNKQFKCERGETASSASVREEKQQEMQV